MGSAACFHLARRGQRVLGLEQFGIPHALGSHHGDTRIIRICYYEHPDYVPLLRRAYELWQELERESGQRLLHITGGIYMGHPACEFVAGALRAAAEHGLEHERVSHDDLRKRFPQFRLPQEYVGVWEPSAGFLLPEKCITAHANLALRHGAELHGHEPALEWQADRRGVSVRTSRDTYSARNIVICGGAWSDRLIRDLGVPLKVTRQVVGWVQPRKPELFAFGTMPVWAIDHPDGTQHYGFPMLQGDVFGSARPGFKIAHHWHGPVTNPDTINRTPQPEDENDFRPTLREMIPDADGPLLSMGVCMYTCTADSHFIIEPPHARPRNDRPVTIACGFSGHGFKFASVVGEVLADLATTGTTRHPIEFLSTRRFNAASTSAAAPADAR
jgi:sarcosine oxidase